MGVAVRFLCGTISQLSPPCRHLSCSRFRCRERNSRVRACACLLSPVCKTSPDPPVWGLHTGCGLEFGSSGAHFSGVNLRPHSQPGPEELRPPLPLPQTLQRRCVAQKKNGKSFLCLRSTLSCTDPCLCLSTPSVSAWLIGLCGYLAGTLAPRSLPGFSIPLSL